MRPWPGILQATLVLIFVLGFFFSFLPGAGFLENVSGQLVCRAAIAVGVHLGMPNLQALGQ